MAEGGPLCNKKSDRQSMEIEVRLNYDVFFFSDIIFVFGLNLQALN